MQQEIIPLKCRAPQGQTSVFALNVSCAVYKRTGTGARPYLPLKRGILFSEEFLTPLLYAEQGINKLFRIKIPQIFYLLADADKTNRNF